MRYVALSQILRWSDRFFLFLFIRTNLITFSWCCQFFRLVTKWWLATDCIRPSIYQVKLFPMGIMIWGIWNPKVYVVFVWFVLLNLRRSSCRGYMLSLPNSQTLKMGQKYYACICFINKSQILHLQKWHTEWRLHIPLAPITYLYGGNLSTRHRLQICVNVYRNRWLTYLHDT